MGVALSVVSVELILAEHLTRDSVYSEVISLTSASPCSSGPIFEHVHVRLLFVRFFRSKIPGVG